MVLDGLIFLPGLMCDGRLFGPQIEDLRGILPMEVADLSRDDSIEAMAERVLAETSFDRFGLIGLSMGGIVSMEIVRQAAHRVGKLALLDTNPKSDTDDRKAQRTAQIARVQRGELRQMMMEELKPFYLAPTNMGDQELETLFIAMAEALGPDVFERQAKALMNREDAQDVLINYQGVSLVMCGEHDKPCPPQLHRSMALLLDNSELVTVPDAGHITTLENPIVVNRSLRWWLKAA